MNEHAGASTPESTVNCVLCPRSSKPGRFPAEVCVLIRRPDRLGRIGLPEDCHNAFNGDDLEILRDFTVEPRCLYHVAKHQKPGLDLERGIHLMNLAMVMVVLD